MALTKELIKTEGDHHSAQGDHWREERALAESQLKARSEEWAATHALREREVAIAEAGTHRLNHIEAALEEMKGTAPRLAGVEVKIDHFGSSLEAILRLLQNQTSNRGPAEPSSAPLS